MRICGLVRARPDVGGVLRGRVVLGESRLYPTLRLGRVARLECVLRHERDACAGSLRADGSGKPGGA